MIRVKIKMNGVHNGIPTFICPGCGHEDVAYMCMPKSCYTCGSKYDFFVNRLIELVSERRYYHFKTKTRIIC